MHLLCSGPVSAYVPLSGALAQIQRTKTSILEVHDAPVFPLLSTDYSFAINETMSEFAEKLSYDVDLGARYASIAIREQLRLIQQGIAALV